MALKYTPKRAKIEFSDGDYVEVRGLSLPDLRILYETHAETVTSLFDKFTGRDPDNFSIEDLSLLAQVLVVEFPAIVAHVIALGADEPEQFETIATLPIDVQASALEKIAHLSFAMQGGAKNFAEIVVRMGEGVSGLKGEVKQKNLLPSSNGSAASKAK
jgi:hypothetical protein